MNIQSFCVYLFLECGLLDDFIDTLVEILTEIPHRYQDVWNIFSFIDIADCYYTNYWMISSLNSGHFKFV